MAKAPTNKALMAWHKDAGWNKPLRPTTTPQHPNALVQWSSVMLGKQCAGIARLELAAPEFCYVADFIINSKFRRRGIGSWFLQAIEQYAGGRGIKRLVLQAEAGSEAFYKAHHFVNDPYVPTFLKKDLPLFQRKVFIPHPA